MEPSSDDPSELRWSDGWTNSHLSGEAGTWAESVGRTRNLKCGSGESCCISILRANRGRLIHELRLIRGADFMGKTQEPLEGMEIRIGRFPDRTQEEPKMDPAEPNQTEHQPLEPNA